MGKDVPLFDNMPGYLQANSNSLIQFCSKKKIPMISCQLFKISASLNRNISEIKETHLNPLQSWMIIFEWFLLKKS